MVLAALPHHNTDPLGDPLLTPLDPVSGPTAFGIDRHRLTAPARPAAGHHGTRGPANEGNSRPGNVGLQHPTAPLAAP